MLEKIESRKRRGQQDEMVGWYQHLNGHEFEQASGDGEGQGSLECCGPWGCKESDTTEQLNNSNKLSLSCLRRSKSTKPPYIVETRSLPPSFLAVRAKWAIRHNYVTVKPST